MELALALARQGVGRSSPNPAVGAVLVRDGEIVGRGSHTWAGVHHAEILALEEAAGRARGATLYVTLEPCCHRGRTGPCADALIKAGVARVVAAMEDPNPEVAGRGLARLREAGIDVEPAPEYTAEAEALNEAFVYAMRNGRPFAILKTAMTLDGKISAQPGDSGWITSERAREHGRELRHLCDGILTGIGTVLADDPMLTDRSGRERSRPLLRILLDSRLRIPLESRLLESARGDLLIVAAPWVDAERRKLVESRGARVIESDSSWNAVLDFLSREKYRSLLIEAGSAVNGSAFAAGIVDKVVFYYAPKILGGLKSLPAVGDPGRARDNPIHIGRLTIHEIGDDEFAVEGYVQRDR